MALANDEIASLLVDLATTGGAIVVNHRERLLAGHELEVHKKSSHADLVTSADLASEQAMIDLLAERRPDDGIISEERGFIAGGDLTWVLDPLDGTANFARGSENFGVIAGLMQGATAVAGAMYLPAIDSLYVAVAGSGATKNGTALHRPPSAGLADAMIDHSLLHYSDPAQQVAQRDTLDAVLANARGVRCDHSVRYMADTVEGVLDGFVYHSLGLWDIVGTSVILGEVGVVVSDLDGNPLDLSPTEWYRGRYYPTAGAAPSLHRELIDVIRQN